MAMTLDKNQHQVLTQAYHEAANFGATAREKKALTEALIVESGIRNLSYGDRDSRGPLQQRPSAGWMHPNDVKLAVRDFLTHARAKKDMKGSAGQLAQAVQVSQYPGRYDAQAGAASGLLQHYGGGTSGGSRSISNPSIVHIPGSKTTVQEEVDDPDAEKRVAFANFLQQSNPHSLLLKLGVVDPNEATTKTINRSIVTGQRAVVKSNNSTTGKMSNPSAHAAGVAHFEGKAVAAWIKPALSYARRHGWKGQVNSGFRSLAEQTRIYNSGVRPAAKPGTSNHEFTAFPGGAIDASDAETLAHILERSPYAKQLVWAGAKDPVHFSHPHNGSY